MNIKINSEKYKEYVIEKRRYFHMNPEASLYEFNTAEVIRKELDKIGLSYEVVAKTGTLLSIKGKNKGKVVLLRADIDALEVFEKNEVPYKSKKDGLMHACGHDAHTAMLLGAVHILNELKNNFDGEVKILFQPAEEKAEGAKKVIEETNILSSIDAAFAIHVRPEIEVGKVSIESGQRMAAADMFKINIKGRSGHAARPHQTIDAVVVASAVVMNLQHLVSRNTNPLDTLVITIGKLEAGTRLNVIAGEALLQGTARSFSNEVWEKIPEQIERVVKNTCEAYGATGTVEYVRGTPPLVNDEKISKILEKSIEKLYGKEAIILNQKSPGGEDFAFFTKQVPGAMAFLGIANSKKGIGAALHNDKFDIDENALEVGTNLYVQFALDFLKEVV